MRGDSKATPKRRRKRKPPPGQRVNVAQKKAAFLEALREHGAVYHAAKAVDVGRRTVYQWRDRDPDFAAAWADAHEDAIDKLEESLYRRGLERDTIAAIFLLKGARPEKYRERFEHTGAGGGPIQTQAIPIDYTKLTDDELELMHRIAARSAAPTSAPASHGAGSNGHRAGAATPS